MLKLRWILWVSLAIVLTTLYYAYGQVTHEFFRNGIARASLGVTAGIVATAMVFCFPKLKGGKASIVILVLSFAVRIVVLPTAPSDDVNRYLWEGKLYSQGVSPYIEAAEHEIYADHRDVYWEDMNHKDKITAYPPLSQHFFSTINRISYSPMSYKVVFMIMDLFLIAVLLSILKQYRRPLHWALLYALSPISVLAFTAEGHFDVIMVLFLMLSILAYSKKWFILCGTAVGLAVATKIMVVIAAPMILLKTGKKGIIAAVVVCAAPFLIHLDDTLQMINGLVSFGSKNNFNGSFNQFIEDIIGTDPEVASKICIGLFAVSWCIGFWFSFKDKLWLSLCFSLGGLLIFAPIVHFWYFAWFLPFVAIRPSLAWVSFSISTPLYFLVHTAYLNTGNWELPVWARWVFWLPFFIICLCQLPQQLRLLYHLLTDKKRLIAISSPRTWSVIIPALEINDDVIHVVRDLKRQSVVPDEIVIVSVNENTVPIPEDIASGELKIIYSARGRGIQIKTGVEHAVSEWCLILHSDNRLAADTFKLLNEALTNNPGVLGGSLGQRFSHVSLGLLLVEGLNEFRATLMNTSFGDQNQFFHREVAIDKHILTAQPLMEDVEMSDRLTQHGDILHLAHESTVSAEKWEKGSFCKRFFTIIGFYLKYRLLFFTRNGRHALSQNFYSKYYPKADRQSAVEPRTEAV